MSALFSFNLFPFVRVLSKRSSCKGLDMRCVRDVLRLHFVSKKSVRVIARSAVCGRTTAQNYIARANKNNLCDYESVEKKVNDEALALRLGFKSDMWSRTGVPMLGVIENMSYMIQPGGEKIQLFPKGSFDQYLKEKGLVKLGEVPFHPQVGVGGEAGVPVIESHPNSIEGQAFLEIAKALISRVPEAKV